MYIRLDMQAGKRADKVRYHLQTVCCIVAWTCRASSKALSTCRGGPQETDNPQNKDMFSKTPI